MSDIANDIAHRKALLDQEIATKLLTDVKELEVALEMGFTADLLTDVSARQAATAGVEFYQANGRVAAGMKYIQDRAIPFFPAITVEPMQSMVPRLRELYVALGLRRLAADAVKPSSPIQTAEKALAAAQKLVEASRSRAPTLSQEESVDQALRRIEMRCNNDTSDRQNFCFPSLTELTGGKTPESVTVVYGLPKQYKSTWTIYDAYYAAVEEGKRVAFGSGELRPVDIHEMWLSFASDVPLDRIREGRLEADDFAKLSLGRQKLLGAAWRPVGRVYPGKDELDIFATQVKNWGADVVYLDGAHRLGGDENEEKVAYAQRVTEHATRDKAPWVVVVQANRYGKNKSKKRVPTAAGDMGGTLAWVQECSTSIRVKQPAFGEVLLEVTDSRFGKTGAVRGQMALGVCVQETWTGELSADDGEEDE